MQKTILRQIGKLQFQGNIHPKSIAMDDIDNDGVKLYLIFFSYKNWLLVLLLVIFIFIKLLLKEKILI